MQWNIKQRLKNQNSHRQSEIIDILLKNRNITDHQTYFNPPHPSKFTLEQIGIDPKQADKATKRIQTAINNREQIIVYGDYDADGVCATAIMWETLQEIAKAKLSRKLSFNPQQIMPYIPDRFTDGYGMKSAAVQKLQSQYPNLKLIITVDNGITAYQAIEYCNSQDIDVILTDHHVSEQIPSAHSVVHTTQTSGSGVAWFFCQELLMSFRERQRPHEKSPSEHSKNFSSSPRSSSEGRNDKPTLGLATIGTVADLLPLTGLNRSLVAHGLLELRKTTRPGLQALFQNASIQPSQIETYHIGYLIGPRLNAMGRLENALDSLRLLCTTDTYRAKQLAYTLHQTNQERQQLTQQMTQHALDQAKTQTSQNIIVVGHESYPEGIIGLIAGKLTEKYHKPAIALSHGESISKASARSISNYNIIAAIRTATHLLDSAGGHPMAAGFTIQKQNVTELTQHLTTHASQNISDQDLIKTLAIDTEIFLNDITPQLYQQIQQFAPFGVDNYEPVFTTSNITLNDFRAVGRQQTHLKLSLSDGQTNFNAIAFNQAYHLSHFQPGQSIDIAYNITENVWNGRSSLELKVKDIKLCQPR